MRVPRRVERTNFARPDGCVESGYRLPTPDVTYGPTQARLHRQYRVPHRRSSQTECATPDDRPRARITASGSWPSPVLQRTSPLSIRAQYSPRHHASTVSAGDRGCPRAAAMSASTKAVISENGMPAWPLYSSSACLYCIRGLGIRGQSSARKSTTDPKLHRPSASVGAT